MVLHCQLLVARLLPSAVILLRTQSGVCFVHAMLATSYPNLLTDRCNTQTLTLQPHSKPCLIKLCEHYRHSFYFLPSTLLYLDLNKEPLASYGEY